MSFNGVLPETPGTKNKDGENINHGFITGQAGGTSANKGNIATPYFLNEHLERDKSKNEENISSDRMTNEIDNLVGGTSFIKTYHKINPATIAQQKNHHHP